MNINNLLYQSLKNMNVMKLAHFLLSKFDIFVSNEKHIIVRFMSQMRYTEFTTHKSACMVKWFEYIQLPISGTLI